MTQPTPPPPAQNPPQSQSQGQSQRTTEAHTAFTASLKAVSSNYDGELQERAKNLQSNAAALEKQEVDLQKATAGLAKQNEQLGKVAETARDGLKEIGDVQNWAELIERDLLGLEDMLGVVEGGGGKQGNGEAMDEYGDGVDAGRGGSRGEREDGVVLNGVEGGGKKKKKAGEGEEDGEERRRGWFRWW